MFFLLSYGELFVNVNMCNVNVSTTVRKPYFLRKSIRTKIRKCECGLKYIYISVLFSVLHFYLC